MSKDDDLRDALIDKFRKRIPVAIDEPGKIGAAQAKVLVEKLADDALKVIANWTADEPTARSASGEG